MQALADVGHRHRRRRPGARGRGRREVRGLAGTSCSSRPRPSCERLGEGGRRSERDASRSPTTGGGEPGRPGRPAGRQGPDAVGPGGASPRPSTGSAGSTCRADLAGAAAPARELRERLAAEGLDHVVLAGMGGSSLAPEVITRTAGAADVLDTTDPHQVGAALADRLERTVVVVASKTGGTVETDSHRRAYEQAFRDAGLTDAEVGRAHRRRHRPRLAADEEAADGGLHRGARRPRRRRPLQRADRVRPGPEPPRRRRRGAAARRRPGARRRARRRRQPRRPARRGARRRRQGRPRQARAGRRRLRHRRASATGPSSWSPSRPASRARASCRSSSRASTRPASPTPARTPTGSSSARAGPALRRGRRSAARSARSSCSGSTPPRSPAMVLGINPFDQPNVAESKENTDEDPRRVRRRAAARGRPGPGRRRGRGARRPRRARLPDRPRRRAAGLSRRWSPTTATSP